MDIQLSVVSHTHILTDMSHAHIYYNDLNCWPTPEFATAGLSSTHQNIFDNIKIIVKNIYDNDKVFVKKLS